MRPTTTTTTTHPRFCALGTHSAHADPDFIGSFTTADDACDAARDYARTNPQGYALVYDADTGTCEGEFCA